LANIGKQHQQEDPRMGAWPWRRRSQRTPTENNDWWGVGEIQI